MTDLERAKANLIGHTLAICKDGRLLYSDKRGIAPMLGYLAAKTDLSGFSAADVVVGKAAAVLFVKAGITAVYARTLSQSGKDMLEKHGIPFEYDALTERIINRAGNDVCPMEKAVADVEDVEEGYRVLCETAARLSIDA